MDPIPLVKLSALVNGRGRRVCAAGLDLAVFLVDGAVYAMDDSCPHSGASLSNGRVQNGKVSCPAHGLRFDLKSRPCAAPDAMEPKSYAVQVVGDLVVLTPPEPDSPPA